jgi:cardiolipin hydrolase
MRDQQIKIAFSPGVECRNLIIELIESATQSLDICVFTISDDQISRAILRAMNKGTQIRIITDNDKAADQGSDIQTLYDEGIEVKTDQSEFHMHHKFLIADGETVLTGSYNWTRNAAEYNEENIICITSTEVAVRFQKEFDVLWEKSVDLMSYE